MKKLTFFSYKGGAGRSTLALNTLPILCDRYHFNASPEHPLIIADLDIDSAGMTYLLNMQDEVRKPGMASVQEVLGAGVIDGACTSILDHPFFSSLCKVGDKFGMEPEAVLFLPALDGTSIEDSNYNAKGNNHYLKDMCKLCETYKCAAVVFDSAVGDQLTANLANAEVDIIICCMRPTEQFQVGTSRFLQRYEDKIINKDIIIVPNVVPMESMTIDGYSYPETAYNRIMQSFKLNLSKNRYNYDMMEHGLGIPMVKSFMWRECMLAAKPVNELTDDEKAALEKISRLADTIMEIKVDDNQQDDDF